ncbi:MAG TPA: hypothetical protein PKC28_02530 [Bdellovibrionales bacterium]|nr:hypothetical protein [Bdellovibrionales bacterium]
MAGWVESRIRHIRLLACGAILSVGISAAAAPEINVTPACVTALGGDFSTVIKRLEQVVNGDGAIHLAALIELANAGVSPAVRADLIEMTETDAFLGGTPIAILPPTVSHHFRAIASTYMDMSTPGLRIDRSGAFFRVEDVGARPRPFVILTHAADDTTILHEAVHLADAESLHEFSRELGGRRLFFGQIPYRVISELRAYKIQMRAYVADHGVDRYLDFLVGSLRNNLGFLLAHVQHEDLRRIFTEFGIARFDDQGLKNYLTDAHPVPAFNDIARALKNSWHTQEIE